MGMPELPEVETLKRDLCEAVVGHRILGASVYVPEIVRHPTPEAFVSLIRGKVIQDVRRQAKYLIFELSDGWTWVLHLMLEGQLLYEPQDTPIQINTKLEIRLDNGYELRLRDVVGLAKTSLLKSQEAAEVLHLGELGPEPIDPDFSLECFKRRLDRHSGMLKPLLLDQRVIAGIGNIYADEALFLARIHPKRKANSLSEEEILHLYEAIKHVILAGIEHRGTSAKRSQYRDLWGKRGHHQEYLKVFRKQGEPCPGCSGTIVETRVGGRATFICPSCQKSP
jgi:formamidopyrimidine-DNA glycosylase